MDLWIGPGSHNPASLALHHPADADHDLIAVKDTPLPVLLIPASAIGLVMVLSAVLMLEISLLDQFPGSTSFTLQHYRAVFANRYLVKAGLRSLSLATVVTLACIPLGYPVS